MMELKFLPVLMVALMVLCVHSIDFSAVVHDDWEAFKAQFGKKYQNPMEERFRMKIFMENSRRVARHNLEYERGLHGYRVEMNKFGDKLNDEFNRVYNGFNGTKNNNHWLVKNKALPFIRPAHVQLPDEVDWRKHGAVTDVKDQGTCGSCWTFSATGALEGQLYRSTEKLVSLSEQNLLDCSSEFGNEGCDGGTVEIAFLYVNLNKGLDTEKSYPYLGEKGECEYEEKDREVEDRGYVQTDPGNEEAMKEAVATVGPIAVAIDANQPSFQLYSGGVYYDANCSSTELSHAVLVVGYGHDKKGGDFWIVKNSWGEDWGEDGYLRMARNRENNCGIATNSLFPIVAKKKE